MSTERHRLYISLDVDVEMPEDWHLGWWKDGAPDWLNAELGRGVVDLTVYNSVRDMVADMKDRKDMFA